MNKSRILALTCWVTSLVAPFCMHGATTVEARVGGFYPSDKRFRTIYGEVVPTYQLEISQSVLPCMSIWLNGDFTYGHGSVPRCGSSKVYLYDINFGPKWQSCLWKCVDAYIGLGVNVAGLTIKNWLHSFHNCECRASVGGIAKGGLNIYFGRALFLDIFCDYLYQPISTFDRSFNLGGVKFGGGLGYRF